MSAPGTPLRDTEHRATGSARGDAVEEYVTALDASLHGPSRAKSRMVAEIHGGFAETVAAFIRGGVGHDQAVRRAVEVFGTVEEVAVACQRELTVVQVRHTARTAALTAPLLLACWLLLESVGGAPESAAAQGVLLLALGLASVAGLGGLLGSAALAATGSLARWLPAPHRLPEAVAWTGTTAGVSLAASAVALAGASILAENWVMTAAVCGLTALLHAAVATSARTCRRCAAIPHGDPVTEPRR